MVNNAPYDKLALVQNELKAPKGQFNKFGNYAYRSCEDILEALKPVLEKYKCCIIMEDSIQNIGDRFYVKSEIRFVCTETRGQVITCGIAREEAQKKGMDGAQITGSASSYARKYALNAMFCIDDTKDADATNKHGKDNQQNQANKKPWSGDYRIPIPPFKGLALKDIKNDELIEYCTALKKAGDIRQLNETENQILVAAKNYLTGGRA